MIQKNNPPSRKIMQLLIVFTCGLLCLSAVRAVPATDEEIQKMTQIMEECVEKTGVDPEVLKKAKKGEHVDDEKLHCFGACFMQKIGVMDADGNIDTKQAIEKLPEDLKQEDTIKIVERCSQEKGDNPCDTARKAFNCVHAQGGEKLMREPGL